MSVLINGFFWLCLLLNGFFLYGLCRCFVSVRESLGAKVVLILTLSFSSGMIIWVGDNNFAMLFPFFVGFFLLTTHGDFVGRLTVGVIFFCFIMSVCAIADNYLISLDHYYDIASRLARPLVFGFFYLVFYKHLVGEPVQLTQQLWKLSAGLTIFPFVTLSTIVLSTYWMQDSQLLNNLSRLQGMIILPVALLSSIILLITILVLADYEKKNHAAALSELREVYYQGLQHEQMQVRTLRHDLRNHLNVVQALLEQGEGEKAKDYLIQLTDSKALQGTHHICENELANVVLCAKREEIERRGLLSDFQISLPRGLQIADIDLCALLGNALDNAMEAAEKALDKQIIIRCRLDKGLFMLQVENALVGDEHPDLSTTKKNKADHGFGITGMREITQRYGGSLETKVENRKFELIVCIPLQSVEIL